MPKALWWSEPIRQQLVCQKIIYIVKGTTTPRFLRNAESTKQPRTAGNPIEEDNLIERLRDFFQVNASSGSACQEEKATEKAIWIYSIGRDTRRLFWLFWCWFGTEIQSILCDTYRPTESLSHSLSLYTYQTPYQMKLITHHQTKWEAAPDHWWWAAFGSDWAFFSYYV
jgi:hypothetical protein